LDTETLSNENVISFAKEHLISIKLDAWNDSVGKELFSQYKGYAIPLLIFLDNKGEEIERILGYKKHDEFLSILNDVIHNKNTFMDLFEKYENGNRDFGLIDKLSIKSEIRNDAALSSDLYQIILDNPESFSNDSIERAELYFAKIDVKNSDLYKINRFIIKYEGSDNISAAYNIIISHYRSMNNSLLEADTYQKLITLIPLNSSILNSYAWRMSELEINLEDALEKVNIGLGLIEENNSSYPQILDTKAEVLWKMKLFDQAIESIDEAIRIDDKSAYYKEQKIKFLNSKEGI